MHDAPSSAPPYVQTGSLSTSLPSQKSLSKLTPKFNISKRSSSRKKRWGTLMEAAKSGKVSKLINRSRSEDSVCNSKTDRYSTNNNNNNSNSPGSDENQTESQSDSNPSLVDALGSGLSSLQSGLSNFGLGSSALAALKRKRKKFSTSRTKQCIKSDDKSSDTAQIPVSNVYSLCDESNNKLLKRASSVPTRNQEVNTVKFVQFKEDDGNDRDEINSSNNKNPLLGNLDYKINQMKSSSSIESNQESQQQQQPDKPQTKNTEHSLAFKSRNGSATLPNLPGVQPVSGSQGWL